MIISNALLSCSMETPQQQLTCKTSQCIPQESALSVSVAPNGMLEVHSYLPEGIIVGHGKYGRNLIATKRFPKGTIMYRGYAIVTSMESCNQGKNSDMQKQCAMDPQSDDEVSVDVTESSVSSSSYNPSIGNPSPSDFMLHLYNPKKKRIESCFLDEVNSVLDICNPNEERRQVYGFDGFINHSCSPNTHHPQVYRTNDTLCYDCLAIKDIQVGDEITCDYDTFDWEADGHQILQCGCGAANCRKQVMGFKNLTLDQQIAIMPYCEPEILEQFLQENPQVVLCESNLPEGVGLEGHGDQLSLIATQHYSEGQEIYTNRAKFLSHDELAKNTYILKVGEHYVRMDPGHHFIHRPDYVEYLGYDTFQDHSCKPNTTQAYQDAFTYTVRAARAIKKGETLTLDYNACLHNQAEHVDHIPSASFVCQCGSSNCRGIIVA